MCQASLHFETQADALNHTEAWRCLCRISRGQQSTHSMQSPCTLGQSHTHLQRYENRLPCAVIPPCSSNAGKEGTTWGRELKNPSNQQGESMQCLCGNELCLRLHSCGFRTLHLLAAEQDCMVRDWPCHWDVCMTQPLKAQHHMIPRHSLKCNTETRSVMTREFKRSFYQHGSVCNFCGGGGGGRP